MEVDDNLTRQVEEVEALTAIYGEEWHVEDEMSRTYSITLTDMTGGVEISLFLQVTLPTDYPGGAPPIYQLSAPWLKALDKVELCNALEKIYSDNIGECILYQWVEKAREFINRKAFDSTESKEVVQLPLECGNFPPSLSVFNQTPEEQLPTTQERLAASTNNLEDVPAILHGEPFVDRKSTFQAHLSSVSDLNQVKKVMITLLANKKIAHATHNIMAYRLFDAAKSSFLQDCDDDGETAAGGRLLHLLQILDVRDVMVVVSRWYGGVLLGPDRFKHINNCARGILQQHGYVRDQEKLTKGQKHKKR
ncbi:PREDICTED: protein IMPACT-like isoform X2 [Priapulus caudatus]|uniref:Protein IMPACT-like isoform X2 n=1 Tax=Priapulus caudatus TaxID=37621 RepID=A0ABM1E8I3_PRICU|nr:PREDICTED: protein IMPACT-like isoform X2 [Priapulus caudatus]